MLPERLEFLNRFDNLYRVIINAVKENKLTERDFYLIVVAKAKSMNQERRERINIKVELPDKASK